MIDDHFLVLNGKDNRPLMWFSLREDYSVERRINCVSWCPCLPSLWTRWMVEEKACTSSESFWEQVTPASMCQGTAKAMCQGTLELNGAGTLHSPFTGKGGLFHTQSQGQCGFGPKVIFWLCKLGLVLAVSFWSLIFFPRLPGWSCPSKGRLGLTVTADCSWMGFQEAITHEPCLSGCTVLNSVSLKIFKWTPPFNANTNSCHGLHFTHKESQAWSCITWLWSYQNQWWSWGQAPVLSTAGGGPAAWQQECSCHQYSRGVHAHPAWEEAVHVLPLEFSGPQLMALILPDTMTFPDRQTLRWSVLMNESSLWGVKRSQGLEDEDNVIIRYRSYLSMNSEHRQERRFAWWITDIYSSFIDQALQMACFHHFMWFSECVCNLPKPV